jgi:ribonucleotide monophosphatase NagD (HAD superfamily)
MGEENIKKYREHLERRFGKSLEAIGRELEIAAIFVIFGVTFSSMTIQILSDILGSKTGHPRGPRRQVYPDGTVDQQAVEFFCTNNDLVWPNTFPVPRYGTCMFTTAL